MYLEVYFQKKNKLYFCLKIYFWGRNCFLKVYFGSICGESEKNFGQIKEETNMILVITGEKQTWPSQQKSAKFVLLSNIERSQESDVFIVFVDNWC